MQKVVKTPRPFLKWAGGKSKVYPHISGLLPSGKITYFEPFVGAGSVFFALYRENRIKKAYLNDLNLDLINAYKVLKDKPEVLIQELESSNYSNNFENFMRVRSLNPQTLSSVESAARFIYLNKTCFNGLFRVNKSGAFNVPYGKYKNPVILDRNNFMSVSEALQCATITSIDFELATINAKKGEVVYFDPPYIPMTGSNFTEYTKDGFSLEDHRRLAGHFQNLVKNDVHCVLSNSASSLAYELYLNNKVQTLHGPTSIGGSADSRKSVKEILVTA